MTRSPVTALRAGLFAGRSAKIPRTLAIGLTAAVLCGGLTGCGSIQELTSSSRPLVDKTASASPKPAATSAVQVAATSTRPSGALDTGTVTHRLKQGNFTVTITYWTSDNAKTYTAESIKTINIAAHIEDADSKHRVTVSKFQVVQDDGTNRATVATDSGTFDVTPPYPYNTVVTLPAATTGATSLALTFRMDLLVETAPQSNTFYRSTALDTLTLPLLTNGAS